MTLLDPLGWAIVFLLCGCALVVLEVFLPSGGVISFFAAIFLGASIWMAFRRDMSTGLGFIIVALVAVPALIGVALKYLPHTPMGKAFLGELPGEDESKPVDPRRQLVGKIGVAQSKMLPSGAVMIDRKLYDAVAQGQAIEKDQPIVVIEVRGNRVMVRAVDDPKAGEALATSEDLLSKPIEEFGLESIDEPPR